MELKVDSPPDLKGQLDEVVREEADERRLEGSFV
jgi:hypothetical protein